MASIPISQLDNFTTIRDEDFIALVDSSSKTTYRVPVTSVGAWMAVSGSSLSSSWASASAHSISSSWASSSISSSVSGHLTWPNTSTASFAQRALSSSWSDRSGYAFLANTASIADTASYYNFTLPSSTPPFADACTSASWASSSLSSSYALSASYSDAAKSASWANTASYALTSSQALTASYVKPTSGGSVTPIAWATVLIPDNTNYSSDTPSTVLYGNIHNKPIVINGYNVSDVSWYKKTLTPNSGYLYGVTFTPNNQDDAPNLLITLTNASSNLNYCVIGSGAETDNRNEEISIAFYPYQLRTSTQFVISMFGHPDFGGSDESLYFSFVVYA